MSLASISNLLGGVVQHYLLRLSALGVVLWRQGVINDMSRPDIWIAHQLITGRFCIKREPEITTYDVFVVLPAQWTDFLDQRLNSLLNDWIGSKLFAIFGF